jgi:hypothetical protein
MWKNRVAKHKFKPETILADQEEFGQNVRKNKNGFWKERKNVPPTLSSTSTRLKACLQMGQLFAF